jgi:hypothetical protein
MSAPPNATSSPRHLQLVFGAIYGSDLEDLILEIVCKMVKNKIKNTI